MRLRILFTGLCDYLHNSSVIGSCLYTQRLRRYYVANRITISVLVIVSDRYLCYNNVAHHAGYLLLHMHDARSSVAAEVNAV